MRIGWQLGVATVFICLSGGLCLPSASDAYEASDHVMAAMKMLDKKDYSGALAAVGRALKVNPSDPIALATRGNIYIELSDFEHAITDHDAVLAIAPDDAGALDNACFARAAANADLIRAREYCDRAVSIAISTKYDTKRPILVAYDTRGFLDLRQGKLEAAIADYDEALKARPKTASPIYGRGVAEIRLGKVVEGRADIAAATKVQRDIADNYTRHGMPPIWSPPDIR
jgi:tetratricopeptide (TPR) repeat protein